MSDLPKGYLRCPRCTATFPGKGEDGKDATRCPGCAFAVDEFRPRTARLVMRAIDPFVGRRSLGATEIVALALIVLSGVGAAVFLLLRR